MSGPDYSKYTLGDLEDAKKHIDQEKYKDRYKIILSEIENRKNNATLETSKKTVSVNTEPRSFIAPYEKSENIGVYYSKESYAGFWVRVTAWLVDAAVLGLLVGLYSYIFYYYSDWNKPALIVYMAATLGTCHIYLAVIKSTKTSTLGFWLHRIKIVNLQGNKPSFFQMTIRFILLLFGPFEIFIDLIWLTGEKTKQTLRDKYVGTYVVKKISSPIGEAKIVSTRLNVLGYNLLYREVDIPDIIK